MASGGDQPEKPDEQDKRSRAEIERAEARAAERARREERRRRRAEKRSRGEKAAGGEPEDARKAKPEKAGDEKPGWRERLAAAAQGPRGEETRTEVIQRRVAAVAIVVVIAVVVLAITDAAPFFDDTSEEERVAETVERFFAAYGDGDTETMCELFGPDVTKSIEAAGATESKGEDPQSCAEVLQARLGTPSEDEKVSVKVNEVRVSGPRAIANIVVKTPGSNRRQIEAVELEMGPEGWLLTTPVVTS
jgi:uncharacterized protein (TIGR02246 family)